MTKGTTDACCEATLELALAQKGYVLPRLIIPMTGRDPPDLNNSPASCSAARSLRLITAKAD
jgi:hypothetical protein